MLLAPKGGMLTIKKGSENALLDFRQAEQVIESPGLQKPGALYDKLQADRMAC